VETFYLGPKGTYTHAAAVRKFGHSAVHHPLPGLVQVFREVEKLPRAYGIVPIENSSEGVVGLTMDLLLESPLSIVAEVYMPIKHHLLSNSQMKDIRSVYAHAQAVAQCRNWLSKNLPEAEVQETTSNARGVELALKHKHGAAIAGQLAAQLYPIQIQHRNIHDRAGNTTRFIVIGHAANESSGKDKTSLIFLVKNRVGALYDALQSFRGHGINMTKIESRPTKREAWEYAFYVDLEGHQEDKEVKKALDEMEEHVAYLKILGSYPDETRWSLA
jgi:chorismate mutase/prephenate dehydratase